MEAHRKKRWTPAIGKMPRRLKPLEPHFQARPVFSLKQWLGFVSSILTCSPVRSPGNPSITRPKDQVPPLKLPVRNEAPIITPTLEQRQIQEQYQNIKDQVPPLKLPVRNEAPIITPTLEQRQIQEQYQNITHKIQGMCKQAPAQKHVQNYQPSPEQVRALHFFYHTRVQI